MEALAETAASAVLEISAALVVLEELTAAGEPDMKMTGICVQQAIM